MRRVAAPTAPPTTMAMISMDKTRARMPKAITNGTNAAVLADSTCLIDNQSRVPVSEPAGSDTAIAARSAASSTSVAACSNRYSIW